MFLFIAVLIFSFTFQPAKSIIVIRDDNIPFVPVRRLTLNPWLGERTMTCRMDKASYDLREGLSF